MYEIVGKIIGHLQFNWSVILKISIESVGIKIYLHKPMYIITIFKCNSKFSLIKHMWKFYNNGANLSLPYMYIYLNYCEI